MVNYTGPLCILITVLYQVQLIQSNAPAVQTMSSQTQGSVNVNNGYAQFQWTIANGIVTFQVNVTAKAWFGIGFGDGMSNVDMALIQVDGSNQATVTDLWSTGEHTPQTDSQQDFTLLNQTVTANSIQIAFSRKLDTGDKAQDTVLVIGSNYKWNFAYGRTTMMLGQHVQMGNYPVSFGIPSASTQSTTQSNTQSFGQILYTIAFLGLIII